MTPARRAAAALAALLLAATAACSGAPDDGPSARSRVQVDTPALRAAKDRARIEPCVDGDPVPGTDLPDLTLPCLGGGPAVDLASVRGPAVVTLWASWCGPCREELPLFQRLHETGEVAVLGVDWQDVRPDGALALLRDTGARFPQLADVDTLLGTHYRVTGLPGMLLVDGEGRVTFRPGSVSGWRQLTDLVAEHTGVRL